MNILDIAITVAILAAVALGAARGILRLAVVGAFLALGWWLGVRYQAPVARTLVGNEEGAALILGFVAVFLPILLAGGLLARLMVKLVRVAELRWMDRLVGAVVGLAVALMLAAAALLPLAAALPADHPVLAESVMAPPLLRLTAWLLPLAPEEVRSAWESHRSDMDRSLSLPSQAR